MEVEEGEECMIAVVVADLEMPELIFGTFGTVEV